MDKKYTNDAIELAQKVKETPYVNHKKRVMTRRDLLGQGFMRMAGAVALPSILTLAWEKRAYGVECTSADTGTGVIPYLHVELSGGASISGNFCFGKQQDGTPFEALAAGSYGSLGLPTNMEPGTTPPITTFGGAFHQSSQLLAGMLSVMSQAAQDKLLIAGGAGTSQDDSQQNPLNGIQLAVTAVGNQANLVQIAGVRGGPTGGRTAELDIGADPSLSKAIINSAEDINQLVDPGLVAERLTRQDAEAIAAAVSAMSEKQLNKFNRTDLPTQIKELVQCGYIGSSDLVSKFDAANLAPANDGIISSVFNLADQEEERIGSITKLLLDGNAAGATLEFGNYDYHGRGRVTQDAMDTDAGRRIGLVLEAAHQSGQAMYIALTSDGSVSADINRPNAGAGGKFDFVSDSGSRGAYLMIALGRTTRPTPNNTQIGCYSDAGAVDTAYLQTAVNPNIQALNIVYNYAVLNNKLNEFNAILTTLGATNPFTNNENQYQAFEPLA